MCVCVLFFFRYLVMVVVVEEERVGERRRRRRKRRNEKGEMGKVVGMGGLVVGACVCVYVCVGVSGKRTA